MNVLNAVASRWKTRCSRKTSTASRRAVSNTNSERVLPVASAALLFADRLKSIAAKVDLIERRAVLGERR